MSASAAQLTSSSTAGAVAVAAPDGMKAWSVAAGAFIVGFVTMGLMYTQGIFVEPLLVEFGQSLSTTSLVVTMPLAGFYGTGLFAVPMAQRFGIRRFVFVGGVIWTIGCLVGSASIDVGMSIVFQGVLTGVGAGMTFWVSFAILPAWFHKYRAMGIGIGIMGSGVGSVVISIGGGQLLSSVGWRRTLQIFGAVGGGLLIVAVMLIDQRVAPPRQAGMYAQTFRLLKVPSYQLFVCCFFCFQMAFFTPYTYLPHYATGLGFDSTFAAFTLAMLGIGSSVGRVCFSPIADYFKVRLLLFKVTMFGAALSLWLWPLCTTESSILALSFFYGMFGGGFYAMFGVAAAELWGPHSVGASFPPVNLASVPGAFGSGPIFGTLVSQSGYTSAVIYASVMLTLAFVFIVPIRFDAAVLEDLKIKHAAVSPPRSNAPVEIEKPEKAGTVQTLEEADADKPAVSRLSLA